MLQRALAAAPAALLRPRADAADGARLARAATTGLSTPGPLSGIPCLRVAPAMACMRTWAAPQGTAGTPRAARRSLSTETSRIAGGRTSRSAVRRTQIRTLNAVSAESKTAPPQSEEILRTIVRPYQSQERLLDRIIPDHELKLEPIVISKSDPVPFSAGTVDKKGW